MSNFQFHPKCQALNLSQLAFADDLFIICGATQDNFAVVRDIFDDFFHFSGMRPNLQKSSIFFSGVSDEVSLVLRDILPIPVGSFPVKHLGVPLLLPGSKLLIAWCFRRNFLVGFRVGLIRF